MCGCWDCFAAMGRAIANLFRAAPQDNRGLYEKVTGTGGAVAVPTQAQVNAWPATPGGLFMNAQNFQQLDHNNMLAATNAFHQILANGGYWTWNPSAPGNGTFAGCRTLQGDIQQAECAAVAHAFNVALTAINPYGLQQAANNFTVSTYSGAYNNQGFIANHAPILNLNPNIYNPTTGNAVNLYCWQDHKTVTWNNTYYDACYDTSYANEADMAAAEVMQSINFTAATFQNVYVMDVFITDDAAQLNARGFYIQTFYDFTTNQFAPDPNAVLNVGGYRSVFIGPFTDTQGNTIVPAAANNFGFDNTTDYLNGVQLH